MTRTYQRSGGLAGLLVAAAVALAACGGSGSTPPQVANLGNSTGTSPTAGTSTAAQPKGNATQLLDEWAACMRKHGDTGQADPTIGANKTINIAWNPAVQGGLYGTNKGGQGNSGPGQYCRAYLSAASSALRGGQPPPHPDLAKQLKFSKCMRSNGITDFPDPTATGLVMNIGGDLNPNNPTFQHAAKLCARETGVDFPGSGAPPPPGTVEIDGSGPGLSNV